MPKQLTMVPGRELSRNPARRVRSFSQIREDALSMELMVDQKWGGRDFSSALAIAHPQVSRDPFAFFVGGVWLLGPFWRRDVLPHRVVVNPRIVWAPKVISAMGFKNVPNAGPMPEGCLSYAYRTRKSVVRYARLLVFYWYPGPFGLLLPRLQWVTNRLAHVFQHECDHLNGRNIYFE